MLELSHKKIFFGGEQKSPCDNSAANHNFKLYMNVPLEYLLIYKYILMVFFMSVRLHPILQEYNNSR